MNQKPTRLKQLCEESPALGKKLAEIFLAGTIGAYDRNNGTPIFQGQINAHYHCKDKYLTPHELMREMAKSGLGNCGVSVSIGDVRGLLFREWNHGRMERKRLDCSVLDRMMWAYKSIK